MLHSLNIITICWLLFLIYWGINWWKVKPAKETAWKSSSGRWTIIWVAVLLYLILRFTFHQKPIDLFTSPATTNYLLQLCGNILVIIGLIVAIFARKTLADNWSSNIELKENHKLITTGVYKYVRHPIYTGLILMGFGSVIASQTFPVALFFIAMIAFLIFKLKKEEELLKKHFPKEYPDYMKKTKALIPFIY